ncbi:ABC transporter ATP-binding protein [Sulfurovum sp. XTW-4]|uniref:ABC transporter ATP-binding protein n=1 Tax=Sulfurovum xiamenensis TaxID=3019066 RepID=A0ABT7QPS0_9BACT|nr:ABC transporter ATP-binding protein [Sulfurovum xiamenensis]MDM5263076.1 ABC transporter ATP-binding protein [Sulfurovum xiamenensis]
MKQETAIRIQNLSKVYYLFDRLQDRLKELLHPFRKKYHHDFYALKDISFEIKKGETVGIVGKNGAGKSTLLKILTGVTFPSEGEVEVNGKVASLLELGAGFNPEMTGLENIYLNGTIMGYTKVEMEQRIDDIITFADIGEFIDQPVKTYSSGMFARLAFSVAINVEPDILIVDEALSVGDIFFVNKCIDKMREFILDSEKTLLFVSHDLTVLRRLVNRVIWLENSQIKIDGEALSVLDKYAYQFTDSLSISQIEKLNIISTEYAWGSYKSRFGTGAAEITEIFINTKPVSFDTLTTLKTHERVEIEFKYTAKKILECKPSVSIAFFNQEGINCFGISQKFQNIKLNHKEEKIKCILNNFNLLRGKYAISIGIWDTNIVIPYDLHERVYDVNVISENNYEDGIFVPDYHWEIVSDTVENKE